jgi:hypothetical protein
MRERDDSGRFGMATPAERRDAAHALIERPGAMSFKRK